jgi:hypothetical protein
VTKAALFCQMLARPYTRRYNENGCSRAGKAK